MKRTVYILVLVLFLFACNDNSTPNRSSVITLTYWSANNQYEIDLARELVQQWNKTHPAVQVKHQPIPEGRSSEEVILASVVGKTTPDVYSNMWPGDVESYVRANALVPLDQFTDFDSITSERFTEEKLQELLSDDGHIYQILWKTNPIMLLYNKRMFAEAGFTNPPATYDDFFSAAEKITKDTDGDGYIDQWVGITQILVAWWQRFFDFYTLYIAASGGKTLLHGNEIAFNNETSVKVFKFLQTLFTKGYFPKERMDARADVFIHNVVATRFVGPWTISQIERYKTDDFEYDFAPVPVPDSSIRPIYTYGDYKSIVIFKNSNYPQQVWEFVKFLISKESDLKLLNIGNQLPIRKDILRDTQFKLYFDKNPKMITFVQQAQYVKGVDNSTVLREIFDAISQEFEACVIYGAKSPQDAVEAAAKRAEIIME